ncbi:MAG: type II toxin-antitoxin system VapC family toxin [Sphingomonadales bacterium]
MFLLDTNVVSELRKVGDGRADKNVVTWGSSASTALFYLSVVTLMELEVGVHRIERRDSKQGEMLRTWLTQKVMPTFENQRLPIDEDIAQTCAALQIPDPRPERDTWIAATAIVHKMVVVTRNIGDFVPMCVEFINPWDQTPTPST